MDTTRRPIRPSEWAGVLEAVFLAEPSDEQSWIEWKSTLNLRSKEHISTTLAKAIIALANRDPIQATAHVGGIGIIVVGLEPGAVHGVTQVDNADLDQALTQYLGSDGPFWQPHWTQFKGKTILIIEVAPPAWGDPPHSYRKAFGPIGDGAIYVRKTARSVPAGHIDVLRLADRYAKRSTNKALDVDVSTRNVIPLPRYKRDEQHLEALLASEKDRLLSSMYRGRMQRNESSASALPYDLRPEPEARSEDQFVAEVTRYLSAVRETWPKTMRGIASYVLPAATFTVTNLSDRNYRQLEIRLRFGDSVDAVEKEPFALPDLRRTLPVAPREWGESQPMIGMNFHSTMITHGPIPPSTTVVRDGGLMLRTKPLDLRPHQSEVLESDFVIMVPASHAEDVAVTWSATATNYDGAAQGTFLMLFEGGELDVFGAYLEARNGS